ncbi:GTPase [Demequina litorisediminis]|uniref:GTPase n=1 Tax=Demequina litorisediminis TaxID=1849022 RepID=UPI0024E105AC|nr:GTPase [Demequina litorisediminis]
MNLQFVSQDEPSEAAALSRRVARLRSSMEWASDAIPQAVREEVAATIQRCDERLALGVEHTVVALAGGTGSGKSSLFNAILGREFAVAGVARPTTSQVSAAVWGGRGIALLDWIGVDPQRRLARGIDSLDAADESQAARHGAPRSSRPRLHQPGEPRRRGPRGAHGGPIAVGGGPAEVCGSRPALGVSRGGLAPRQPVVGGPQPRGSPHHGRCVGRGARPTALARRRRHDAGAGDARERQDGAGSRHSASRTGRRRGGAVGGGGGGPRGPGVRGTRPGGGADQGRRAAGA